MKESLSWREHVQVFWEQTWAIARKELSIYFGSPVALIFVGVFLVATMASFFWIEAFFARNIADVRPLFRQMPLLMIVLVPALTMRQWSEEARAGTLEVLLTLPVRRSSLVLGKFVSILVLVGVALALTLFLPVSVSMLGPLDWGPVVGGYLASLFVAAAYAAVGLFVSSRTDNQIVSLIVTVLLCVALYGLGARVVTDLVNETTSEILRALGTGSRFDSIERGVLDLRDVVYYVSLTALFLALNMVSLDQKRWSTGQHTAGYRRMVVLRVALVGANLMAMNVWLFPISTLRLDLTAQQEYSLSATTRELIRNLREPLLIRAYLSEQTHPLLAPLVPTIRDMIQEYDIAAGGKIAAEVVDPRDDPELEEEANQVYGIQPVPFRISGRYEDSIINSYFDILIRYGDQSVVLGFQDLIEIETVGNQQVNVRLRNLEYDLTRSIKKVVEGFQSLDTVFASLDAPVKLTAIVTPASLPQSFSQAPEIIDAVAQEMVEEANGQFVFETIDPSDPNAGLSQQELFDMYGIQPFAVSLFSPDTYYLHLVLEIDNQPQVLYPSGSMSEAELRTEIEAALRREAPGFLKTVGLWHPSEDPVPNPYGGGASQPLSTWQGVRTQLEQDYAIELVDLTSGRVPGNVDALVVIAPQGMTDRQRFAIDQYLMRGGAVIVASGAFMLSPQQFGAGITIQPVQEGLSEMLASYGVTIEDALVMDPQNEPFPIPVQRDLGGVSVVEIQQISYPFFVDVRPPGMAKESAIVANLPAVTLQWVSPLGLDSEANAEREATILMESTSASWLRTDPNVNPDLQSYPEFGFPVEGEQMSHPLAVSVVGSFDSYFQDRPSLLEQGEGGEGPPAPDEGGSDTPAAVGTIDASPDSSRLVVIGSAEFVDDVVLEISRSQSQDRYRNNLQLLQQAVDWAVEDEALLSIRSQGTFTRLLVPLSRSEQTMWEVLNYGFALLGLIAVGVFWYMRRRNEEPTIPVEVSSERVEQE